MTTTVSTSQANGSEYTWASANFAWNAYPANSDTWADDFMRSYGVSAGESWQTKPNGVVRSLAFSSGNYIDVPASASVSQRFRRQC
jgi:hypothetical protein